MEPETDVDDACVWCGKARVVEAEDPGYWMWLETMATPPCGHETLDGRR